MMVLFPQWQLTAYIHQASASPPKVAGTRITNSYRKVQEKVAGLSGDTLLGGNVTTPNTESVPWVVTTT